MDMSYCDGEPATYWLRSENGDEAELLLKIARYMPRAKRKTKFRLIEKRVEGDFYPHREVELIFEEK